MKYPLAKVNQPQLVFHVRETTELYQFFFERLLLLLQGYHRQHLDVSERVIGCESSSLHRRGVRSADVCVGVRRGLPLYNVIVLASPLFVSVNNVGRVLKVGMI